MKPPSSAGNSRLFAGLMEATSTAAAVTAPAAATEGAAGGLWSCATAAAAAASAASVAAAAAAAVACHATRAGGRRVAHGAGSAGENHPVEEDAKGEHVGILRPPGWPHASPPPPGPRPRERGLLQQGGLVATAAPGDPGRGRCLELVGEVLPGEAEEARGVLTPPPPRDGGAAGARGRGTPGRSRGGTWGGP